MKSALVIQLDAEPFAVLGQGDYVAAANFKDKLAELFKEIPRDTPLNFTIKKVSATEEELATRQDW